MSLYHEAASVLTKSQTEAVSIRTVVFAKKDWKTSPKLLLALASEAGKWSGILSEVIEKSGILKTERQLTPVLAIVLVHDLLLAKRGVALPATHGLNACVQRNKARLNAELTKSRLRNGCATIEQLRAKIEAAAVDDNAAHKTRHPRWIRVNLILSSMQEQLKMTFVEFREVQNVEDILNAAPGEKVYFRDTHIPNLLAVPSTIDLTSSKAYRRGQIIFQDKASCFPAYLIDPQADDGDFIDACAAPGNKTTHLAAILHERRQNDSNVVPQHIFACEKDVMRSKTLSKMVSLAGGDDLIQIQPQQNFLKLDPNDAKYANTTKLLLDPSCSGSGITQRDQHMIKIYLPEAKEEATTNNRKRKRTRAVEEAIVEETMVEEQDENKLEARLNNLAEFQLRIVLHAMSFPAAKQISYSTCSIHARENEEVVVKALCSDIAIRRGWQIQRRDRQVSGMQKWHIRGDEAATIACLANIGINDHLRAHEIAQGCIRCDKRGEDGTMGFFVAGFVRDPANNEISQPEESQDDHHDDWTGFDDA